MTLLAYQLFQSTLNIYILKRSINGTGYKCMQYPATQMRRPLRVLKSKIHIMIVTYSIPKHRPLQLLPKHYGLSQLGRAPCALRPWGCLQEDITGMNHPKSLMHKISHSPHSLTNLTPCHSHSSLQRSISQTTLQPINQSTEYDFGGLQPDRDRLHTEIDPCTTLDGNR